MMKITTEVQSGPLVLQVRFMERMLFTVTLSGEHHMVFLLQYMQPTASAHESYSLLQYVLCDGSLIHAYTELRIVEAGGLEGIISKYQLSFGIERAIDNV